MIHTVTWRMPMSVADVLERERLIAQATAKGYGIGFVSSLPAKTATLVVSDNRHPNPEHVAPIVRRVVFAIGARPARTRKRTTPQHDAA